MIVLNKLNVLIEQEREWWVAVCLERFITAQAKTLEELVSRLGYTLKGYLDICQRERVEPFLDYPPAPQACWERFRASSLRLQIITRPEENDDLQQFVCDIRLHTQTKDPSMPCLRLREFIRLAQEKSFVLREVCLTQEDDSSLLYLKKLLPPVRWYFAPIQDIEDDDPLTLLRLRSLCKQLDLPLASFGVFQS